MMQPRSDFADMPELDYEGWRDALRPKWGRYNPEAVDLAAQLRDEGIEIARAFPPFDHWVRISIGLPAENVRARDAIEKFLG
jgi:hypothetical protein